MSEGERGRCARELGATAASFGLLAIALTWPLALNLTSRYPAIGRSMSGYMSGTCGGYATR